jgi:tetratricopeptide (TPR) repeat protein
MRRPHRPRRPFLAHPSSPGGTGSRAPHWRVVLAAAIAVPFGCAARPSAPPRPPSESNVIHATPTVITPYDETDRRAAFERARALLNSGAAQQAARLFDDIARAAPSGPFAAPAVFNAGIAWENAGRRDVAILRFGDAVERFGPTDIGKASMIRATRLFAFLERWSALSAMADLLLARTDTDDVERLEAYGAKALAVVEVSDPDAAKRFISKGRDIIDALALGEGGKLPVEAAQVFFALGEVRRLESEKIELVSLPEAFAEVLERRCQALLDAQSAYSDAMRSYDPHWAAMSGYRVGQLYRQLHDDLLAISPPKAADTADKKQLFLGAMRLRYRVLLEKGLTMMEHTILLSERTGETSAWIDRAKEAKRDLERALEREKAQLRALPYAEKDIERALRDIGTRNAGPQGARR